MSDKKTLYIFLIITTFVIIMLSSCKNDETIFNDEANPYITINTEEISDYMKYQQCDHGGFADKISLSIINYLDFYDTYASLYSLELCDYKLSDDEHTRAVGFLEKINVNEKLNYFDELDEAFFYLRIADFLQYSLPDEELQIVYDYPELFTVTQKIVFLAVDALKFKISKTDDYVT